MNKRTDFLLDFYDDEIENPAWRLTSVLLNGYPNHTPAREK